LVAKETGTVRIKLTHFYNFSIIPMKPSYER
jgi:hypothetical protein